MKFKFVTYCLTSVAIGLSIAIIAPQEASASPSAKTQKAFNTPLCPTQVDNSGNGGITSKDCFSPCSSISEGCCQHWHWRDGYGVEGDLYFCGGSLYTCDPNHVGDGRCLDVFGKPALPPPEN